MVSKKSPRSGSMQFWPRKRSKRPLARVRSWPACKEAKPLGFAGYKVGMTHLSYVDNYKHSKTKGQEISVPVTVIECPPLVVISARYYVQEDVEQKILTEVFSDKLPKELGRAIILPKKVKQSFDKVNADDYDFIRILVATQPKATSIGKKKPDVFELAIGGSKEDQLNYVKENLGKEFKVSDLFADGQLIDIHAITKGKGFQGPVKRFGISLRHHKSEKSVRNPGSLGPWRGQGHIMYRVPHAGKMGFHMRTDYNKVIFKVGTNPDEINPKGGFLRYGLVKGDYILVKGSVAGSSKRIVRFTIPMRPNKKRAMDKPNIKAVSLDSKQGC